MNNTPPEINTSDNKNDSPHMMCFGRHRVQHWAVYLTLGIITAVLFVVIITLGTSFQHTPQPSAATVQHLREPVFISAKHGATDYLISKLKSYGLWKIHPSQEVPRLLIESYPADLQAVDDISIRKRVFLHSLLPHALFVRQEALQKRDRLESILSRIDCSLEDINFDADLDYETGCSWSDFLAEEDIRFIEKLCRNYRTTTAEGLLERVDAVPTSIILAQGALESSWGSSRFTREGNSIFGMWTWKNKGMVPSRREEGKKHKVTAYGNILDSVRAYHLTLNRLNPYDRFRQLRRHTNDPLILADGLMLYSERGEEYVEDIKRVILSNDLQKYDNCRLSDIDLPGFSGPVNKKPTPAAKPAKASL
jgi:Bax protein